LRFFSPYRAHAASTYTTTDRREVIAVWLEPITFGDEVPFWNAVGVKRA
jgi:hypothetical protein